MGRDKRNEKQAEHWTKMIRHTMETAAWRALSPTAQALIVWLKLEWRGPQANNNGRIRLSVRQAAERMGVGINTAARAFHELQAKGFIVCTEGARLGVGGEAKSPAYEITELAMPGSDGRPRKLFADWRSGHDFPVMKAAANNPNGSRRKAKPHHQNGDSAVTNIVTFRK
ncbi:helix-turn-helix domain-containing protein [Oceaniradius stylonematis]|uniref:helix-turn-helix domain-containing protein n=1 Tax=Oceaniradius stylonematis TaxID=2184161 RepID=UPI003C7DAA5B